MLGLRKGEVLGLKWDDVDLEAAQLTVGLQLQRGRRELLHRATKTEASDATLPLPPICVAGLRSRVRGGNARMARFEPTRLLWLGIGERAARYVNISALILGYMIIIYLVFVARFFTPAVLIVFLAWDRAWRVIKLLRKPRPSEAPPGFALWPRWFSTPQLKHIRLFGGLYILGILVDNLLRIFMPAFWH